MQDVLEVMRQIVLGMEESADIIAESSNILVENMKFFKGRKRVFYIHKIGQLTLH